MFSLYPERAIISQSEIHHSHAGILTHSFIKWFNRHNLCYPKVYCPKWETGIWSKYPESGTGWRKVKKDMRNYTGPGLANWLCSHFLTDLETSPVVKLNGSEWQPKESTESSNGFLYISGFQILTCIRISGAYTQIPTPRI